MRDRARVEGLKALAYARAEAVLGGLGIGARPKPGGYILMRSPAREDRRPSLVVWCKGGSISFRDYATGEQGDVYGLVAYVRGWTHLAHGGFREAARWLEDLLGVRSMSEDQRAVDLARARARAAEDQAQAAARLEEARDRAFGLWLKGRPIQGTPVEAYFAARDIGLGALAELRRSPAILRYLPDHPHRAEDGTVTAWPCMIAGCVDYTEGKIRAVHRTWIARDGADKAPVIPARKCWPDYAGCVIPLWRGSSGMSVRDAAAHGLRETLVIVEGVEDGLSAALAAPEYRIWAAISLGNIGNVALPECVDSVIVHRQNDWLKLQAVEAFDRAVEAIEAQGRPVSEVRAVAGKDLNDTLRGGG